MVSYTKTLWKTDSQKQYIEGSCLSSDSKPTDVANGSTLVEMDTSKVYFFDETNAQWREW